MIEDLGIKIGTPELDVWQRLKDRLEQSIVESKAQRTIDEMTLKLANEKIEEINLTLTNGKEKS